VNKRDDYSGSKLWLPIWKETKLGLNLSQNSTFPFEQEKYKSLGGITRPGSLGVLSAFLESDQRSKKAPL